jgi:hypothetical protein
MFGVLSGALVSFDRLCGHIATILQQSEPQVFGSIVIGVLFWFLFFPPRNDADEA